MFRGDRSDTWEIDLNYIFVNRDLTVRIPEQILFQTDALIEQLEAVTLELRQGWNSFALVSDLGKFPFVSTSIRLAEPAGLRWIVEEE